MLVLMGLLLVLAVRLTMTEGVRESMSQVGAEVAARHDPEAVKLPEVGAGVTVGLSCVTILLAGCGAWWAGRRGALMQTHVLKWVLIVGILGVGVVSVFAAAGRFYAMVGLFDVGMGLLGGWGVSVICRAMGDVGRRMVVAVVVGILATWAAKGFYQRFVEIPDTIDYYEKNKEKALAAQGMNVDDPGTKLFESRMMSKEVGGFVTLSNVMATGMVGMLAVVGGVIGAGVVGRKKKTEDEEERAGEIPIGAVLAVCAGVMLVAGLIVTFLSASRGGSVMAVVCVAAIAVGIWKWEWVAARRRGLLIGAVVVFVLGMGAMVGYGVARDTLPSKSMMFRWHYWTGAAGMIRDHAMWGVGLNDFGDYYSQYKRESSPEEVKDPHSFFVRFAAEMGVPGAVGVAGLLAWMVAGMVRRDAIGEEEAGVGGNVGLVWGGLFCLVWWFLHQVIAEPWEPYTIYLNAFSMVIGWGGFAVGWVLTDGLSRGMVRGVMAAGAVGALGMFVYDQVNMALVTGGVAMLFWVLLGVADSYGGKTVRGVKRVGVGLGVVQIAAGVLFVAAVWVPLMMKNMEWDPEPYQVEAEEALLARHLPEAETSLNKVLYHAPMSVDAMELRVQVRRELGEPVAEDIRRMLALTKNARFWLKTGLEAKELPAADRVKILERARELNEALPKDEVMRFTQEEERQLRETLGELGGK